MKNYVFVILIAITFSFFIPDAFAYIDPSSGSMFVQALLGAFVGLGIAVKIYWEKIKSKLFNRS
jgi:hypothetical protein